MKLVLAAVFAFMALGVASGNSIAQAAPHTPPLHCTGTNSLWEDTDIVHLTKQGAGTLTLAWRARGHTTLQCGAGNPLTNQTVRIEQHIEAHVHNGAIRGRGQTRVVLGNHELLLHGSFIGTTTVNQGTLSVQGDWNGNGKDYVMRMRQAGTLDIAAEQWTMLSIIGVLIDAG